MVIVLNLPRGLVLDIELELISNVLVQGKWSCITNIGSTLICEAVAMFPFRKLVFCGVIRLEYNTRLKGYNFESTWSLVPHGSG